jgi:hypothetical protein
MKIRSLLFTAALALAGAAAHAQAPKKDTPAKQVDPPPKAAEKKSDMTPQEVERFLAFYNKFVDALVANKDDCNKMAGAINTLVDTNQDMIKKIQQAKADGRDLPKEAKEKILSRVPEVQSSMSKCGMDQKVMAAMKRMDKGDKAAAKAPPAKAEAPKTETKTEPKK